MKDLMRVTWHPHPHKLAGAIAGLIGDHQHTEMQAIGARAVHTAVKVIVFAKEYLQEEEIHIAFTVSTGMIEIEGRWVTAMRFIIEPSIVG